MCLVTFIKNAHPEYPLILLANRDELYDRPAAPIHRWTEYPNVTAGMDLKEYGTWLGYTDNGRIIVVLNHPFQDWEPSLEPPRSRGKLLKDYLTKDFTIEDFEQYLRENRTEYNGYHLLYGTFDDLRYYSNIEDRFQTFDKGLYCLANTKDDLSNHRVDRSSDILQQFVDAQTGEINPEELTAFFMDKEVTEKMENYPKELDREMAINNSSIFIEGEDFGTVGTTALLVKKDGTVHVREVTYDRGGITEVSEIKQKVSL